MIANGTSFSKMGKKTKEKKVLLCGDTQTGKTSFLLMYHKKALPAEIPNVTTSQSIRYHTNKKNYYMMIVDMSGRKEHEKMRPIAFTATNVFLMFFAIDNKESYDNILNNHYPAMMKYAPRAKIILVGTKSDLRSTGNTNLISQQDGEQLAVQIQAEKYMECSTINNTGVNEIIEIAQIEAAVKNKDQMKGRPKDPYKQKKKQIKKAGKILKWTFKIFG